MKLHICFKVVESIAQNKIELFLYKRYCVCFYCHKRHYINRCKIDIVLVTHKTLIGMDPRLKHPFTGIIAGPTSCGKSTLVKDIIKNKAVMIHPVPTHIVWFYGEWQPMYDTMPGVEFVEGLPNLKVLDSKQPTLVIIDDLMSETDKTVTTLFTKGSHHHNLSILHLVQNLFDKNKHSRTISLNAHYLILFKNPRDASQITHLAKQMYPGHIKFLQEAFGDATTEAYGYLLIDLKQETPEHLRLRTNVLPGDTQYVYMRKT